MGNQTRFQSKGLVVASESTKTCAFEKSISDTEITRSMLRQASSMACDFGDLNSKATHGTVEP